MMFKTLDVAIGVVFLYLLITLIASALVEGLSLLRNWRAHLLYSTIQEMLPAGGLVDADQLYASQLIASLGRSRQTRMRIDVLERSGWGTPSTPSFRPPSYIPAGTFSAGVVEGLLRAAGAAHATTAEEALAAISTLVKTRDDRDALSSVIRSTFVTQGQSIPGLRFAIEKWFNDTMD